MLLSVMKAALNVDGMIFHSTYKSQESAEETAARVNGEVRPYGVQIKKMEPPDGLVKEWEKYPGFSVWI